MESLHTNHKQRFPTNINSASTTSMSSFVEIQRNSDSNSHSHASVSRSPPIAIQQLDHKTDEDAANGSGSSSGSLYVVNCESFKPHKPKQPGLRANVFVSKDCTRDLSEHIVEENWGSDNGMLYKYLDYIFRCQIFDNQVKKVSFSTKEQIVLFHTGLQRRYDHNFLYFVLKQNDPEKRNAEQRWRVPAVNINQSCFSKQQLKDKFHLKEQHLPQRTKFYNSLQDLLFDDSYEIEVNWPERLRTNKERIYQELKQNVKEIEKNKLVSELTEPFNCALKKAEKRAKANPRLAVAQGFVETKHYKKRVELLLPLKVEYPKESGKFHTFALALRKAETSKKYTGMSLLTMSMAYANARLVGYVDSSWLANDSIKKDKKGNTKKEDKERSSTHNSPRTSAPNHSKDMKSSTMPSNMITNANLQHHGFRTTGRITYHQGVINRSRGSNSGGLSNVAMQNLPAIPSNLAVNMDNNIVEHPYGIQTTNIYHGVNPWQQYSTAPYIDARSEQSDIDPNPPLSIDKKQQQRLLFESGAGLPSKASTLKYAQSAYPTTNPPKLHHELPDDDELEDDLDDDLAQELTCGGLPAMLDGTSEAEIQNVKISCLKYGASEPAQDVIKLKAVKAAQQQRHHHAMDYYTSQPVAKLPHQVTKYAQPTTQQHGFVPYQKTHYSHDAASIKSAASDGAPKYLLQLSQLPGDCGVNTLRHIFSAFSGSSHLQSVHLVDDDKTAVLRFAEKAALDEAMQFVSQFSWRAKIIFDSPHLKNYDQQHVWQYQESNKWKAHHAEMGKLIESIPARTDIIIVHGNRRYFIEKYNKQQGRQTNLRTKNQRMIRRIRITVWAPPTNPIRALAIPRIIPQALPPQHVASEMYDGYIYGTSNNQQMQYNNYMAAQQAKVQMHKSAKASIAHSTPPKFDANEYNKLQPEQRILPSNISSKTAIKYDKGEYTNWERLEDGEPDYAIFAEACNTTQFSGIWWYSDNTNVGRRRKFNDGKQWTLYYVPDADDAQDVFENGFTASAINTSYAQVNLTFYESVKKAAIAIDAEDVIDDDDNLKIFECSVFLSNSEQANVDKLGFVNITDASRVELVACCSVNVEILQSALGILMK